MGVYALSEPNANGAPRFVKRLAGGGAHYLYRCSDDGCWMAAPYESDIAKNRGYILSSRAADLPSKAGLGCLGGIPKGARAVGRTKRVSNRVLGYFLIVKQVPLCIYISL